VRSNRSSVALAGDAAVSDAAVADGGVVRFEELYRSCAADAWRVARSVTGNDHDASDAVADAFTRLFNALSAGRVTHVGALRPYLLTATRNAAVDILRGSARVRPTPEVGPFEGMVLAAGPSERTVAADDCAVVAQAFAELPARWQSVLWLTEVEDLAPREAAEVLGLTPNNVSQLAVRARARLRERYLQGHVAAGAAPGCPPTVERLGAFAAGRLPRRRAAAVAGHLEGCPDCRDRLDQLDDLGLVLRRAALPFPAVLVGTGVGWRDRLWPGRRTAERAGPAPEMAAEPGSSMVQAAGGVAARVDPSVIGLVQQLAASPAVQGTVAAAAAGLLALGVAGVATHDRPADAPAPRTVTVEAAETARTTTTAVAATPAAELPPVTTGPAPPPPPDAATRPPPDAARRPVVSRTSTVAQGAVDLVGVSDFPGAPAHSALANPQASGAPLVLLVQEDRGEWLNVLLPVRPNGSTGWVRRSEVRLDTHDFQIVVQLGAHRITVYDGASVLLEEPIAVGTSDAPTPGGLYYTTALVQPADAAGRYDPGGAYGPYAYPLSGFSDVLFDFAGGDGRIGIHGTNAPSSLGTTSATAASG